jgi:hypothetical protein
VANLVDIARRFEAAALQPDAASADLPFEPAVSRALIQSRRLRVLDWLAQSGFSLVNMLDGVEEAFLDMAAREDLRDKYDAARLLASHLRLKGWQAQVASLEVLLVEARRPRPEPLLPQGDSDVVRVAQGAVIESLDLGRALALHEALPSYDVPRERRAGLLAALELPHEPELVSVLAIGPCESVEGFVAEIEPALVRALFEGPRPWGEIAAQLTPETAQDLLEQRLVERVNL